MQEHPVRLRAAAPATALLLLGCTEILGLDAITFHGDDAGAIAHSDAGRTDAGRRDGGPPPDAAGGVPDLSIACSTGLAVEGPGDLARVPWTVSNLGTAAGGPFRVGVLLQRPAMTAGGAPSFIEVGSSRYPGRLAPDAIESGEATLTVPTWVLAGENPVRCVIDADEEVVETDETNNTGDATLAVTGLPDLVPTVSSSDFVCDSTCQSRTATFYWAVRNDGRVAAIDIALRVGTGCGDLVDGPGGTGELFDETIPFLAPGAATSGHRELTWEPFCDEFALAFVDGTNEIPESNESNNLAIRAP